MGAQYLRYLLANAAMLAAAVAIACGGAAIWVVAIAVVAIGGPADEALGDDESRLSGTQRVFFNASLYATLPLLALITLAMLHLVAVEYQTGVAASLPLLLPEVLASWSFGGKADAAAAVFLAGYCYAVFGATVGHELTHRTGVRPAFLSARGLFAFTFNTSFTTFHVHGHHRQVGTWRDPATARRGEYILAFVVRTIVGQFVDALEFEAARARRLGHSAYGLRNRVIAGQLYSLAIVIAAAVTRWSARRDRVPFGRPDRAAAARTRQLRAALRPRAGGGAAGRTAPHLGLQAADFQRAALQSADARGSPHVRSKGVLATRDFTEGAAAAVRLPDHGVRGARPCVVAQDDAAACSTNGTGSPAKRSGH